MAKLMIFCTCCDFRKDFYLMRASNWFHNLKQIKSLQPLDPDFYIMHDGELTLEDIAKADPSLLKESHLYIKNHKPMLGRTSDLSFPGWIRSFVHALEIGMEKYDYIVHIESDVLLLHPDKIVSYFDKPGMYCSHWFGREIADSTLLIMNDKESVKRIHDYFSSRDYGTAQLVEGIITGLAPWQYVFLGGRLENEASHLTMDLDFIAQLYRSEAVNPYSKSISDATANHVYFAVTDEINRPEHRQYIPIQCTSVAKERLNCYHDDDNPDNIADKYKLYGCLTALYAAWKLDKANSDNQGIGFVCDDMWFLNGGYHLPNVVNNTMCFDDIATKDKSESRNHAICGYDFQQYDIVLPRRQIKTNKDGSLVSCIGTMYMEYGSEFYHTLEDVIRANHFDYSHKIWKDFMMDELIAQPVRSCFITKKYLFDKFCDFFFSVCSEMEDEFNKNNKLLDGFNARNSNSQVFKCLLPYMLGLFCYRNKLVVKETQMIQYTDRGGVAYAKPIYD